MKKIKLLIVALLVSCALFVVLPSRALASDFASTPCNGTDIDSPCGGGSSDGSSLPIDGEVWFLIAAAALIGTKVIINKSKTPKVAPVTIR